MLNLSEAWKMAYAKYLEEESSKLDSEIDKLLVNLAEAHEDAKKGFSLVEDYFKIYSLSEGVTLNEWDDADVGNYVVNSDGSVTAPSNNHRTETGERRDQNFRNSSDISDVFKNIIDLTSSHGKKIDDLNYSAEATVSVTDIKDMKFPGNLIFFIKQVIKWIKNIVLYFIESFRNVIRTLLGDKHSVTELNKDALKLNLDKSKEIETISTIYKYGKSDGKVTARVIKDKDVKLLEGLFDSVITKQSKPENERVIISLDLSKDIDSLGLLVQHFYDLFDNAFGSFNEKLFETDDLGLVLKILKDTFERIKSGDPAIEVNLAGTATEIQTVNSSVVRQNLVVTNDNITKLKKAYMSTAEKIKDIAKIINSKELLMLTDLGAKYRVLTVSTLGQIDKVAKTIPVRLKEAEKLEKGLAKVKKQYEDIVEKLSKAQRTFLSVSNITYNTTFSRKLNDLFVAARYMSDIVTLRLSGLALYIKELKDVRNVLVQLLGVQNLRK